MPAITWAVVLLAVLACTQALGTETSVAEFPSIVQVEFYANTVWTQRCVGSVLTNYHIISAASCFDDDVRNRRIRAGTSIRGLGGIVREINVIYNHPSYGSIGKDGDITVISLESAITLGPSIQQAAILGDGIYLPEDLQVILAGWGTTAEGNTEGDENLYELELYTINDDKCLEQYIFDEIITENMICAGLSGTGGRDLDEIDIGAPIFYSGTTVGIVSFGKYDGEDEYPIVGTAIASYSSWIVDTASKL